MHRRSQEYDSITKEIVHICSPTAAEIEAAQQLIDAFEAHAAQGKGVFAVNGRMVDIPIVHAAQHILEICAKNR